MVLYCRNRFKKGFRLLICWLMMKLAFGSKQGTRGYAYAYYKGEL